MASNLKKAGSVIRNSFRTKRYAIFDAEENNYIVSPEKRLKSKPEKNKTREISTTSVGLREKNENISNTLKFLPRDSQSGLKKGASMTQSMRVAVGTLRQKLKIKRQPQTPKRAGRRNSNICNQDVHLYSPFKIDTPNGPSNGHVRACVTLETPGRLKREVDALTTNMQALSALTPNTLRGRAAARRSPRSTNSKFRTPRSSRKRIVLA